MAIKLPRFEADEPATLEELHLQCWATAQFRGAAKLASKLLLGRISRGSRVVGFPYPSRLKRRILKAGEMFGMPVFGNKTESGCPD